MTRGPVYILQVSGLDLNNLPFQGGGVTRYKALFSLGRRSVNLWLPVAQWTSGLKKDVSDRPWIVGREFESHVHHERTRFLK